MFSTEIYPVQAFSVSWYAKYYGWGRSDKIHHHALCQFIFQWHQQYKNEIWQAFSNQIEFANLFLFIQEIKSLTNKNIPPHWCKFFLIGKMHFLPPWSNSCLIQKMMWQKFKGKLPKNVNICPLSHLFMIVSWIFRVSANKQAILLYQLGCRQIVMKMFDISIKQSMNVL